MANTSENIGVVYEAMTKEIRFIIDPTTDDELDDPAWTTNETEMLALIRIPRGDVEDILAGAMSPENINTVQEYAKTLIG